MLHKIKHTFLYLLIFPALSLLLYNCSSSESSDCTQTWYQDNDGDGLGNPNTTSTACERPLGYVDNGNDTDDTKHAFDDTNTLEIPAEGYTTPSHYDGMTMIWSDEFEDNSLNANYWTFQTGDGCPGNCGWGNNELEFYSANNTSLENGYLVIKAKEENAGGKNYTSSRITTQGKFTVNYGRIDVRAALPEGQGIWPAIWMLGENITEVSWPACGEIDIMEMVGGDGKENTVHGTAHWDHEGNYASYGQGFTLSDGTFKDAFHVFSIVWNSETITWYVDDEPFNVIDITPEALSEFQNDFHLLLNLAVGGNWPGTPDTTTTFPQFFIVDYVRVFQQN